MVTKLSILVGLLILRKASAEYLRERHLDEQPLVAFAVSDYGQNDITSKETGVPGAFDDDSTYKVTYTADEWDIFLADQFSSVGPTARPSRAPNTKTPTGFSIIPTPSPTKKTPKTPRPTNGPTVAGTARPTNAPRTPRPTNQGGPTPTTSPVIVTNPPTITQPTLTNVPTAGPSTATPTAAPKSPTVSPALPTVAPLSPTMSPTIAPTGDTLWDVINTTPRYSSFANALKTAGLSETTKTEELTVFAPNNAALNNVYFNSLLDNVDYRLHLTSLLQNHLTNQGVYTSANLTNGLQLTMLGAELTDVIVNTSGTFLNTFAARLGYTGRVPVNLRDTIASNGVLQEVNTILSPAFTFLNLLELLDLLNASFSTLISLLNTSGLDQVLSNAQDITLIAPTNDAFNKLPPNFLASLQDPANIDQLTELLLYHVVPKVINFDVLPPGNTSFTTQQGSDVIVTSTPRQNGATDLFFNGFRSALFFLTRWNIMYQLDEVLFPPGTSPGTRGPTSVPGPTSAPSRGPSTAGTLSSIISSTPDFSTLNSLIGAVGGDLGSILNNPASGPFTVYAPTNSGFAILGDAYLQTLLQNPGYSLQLSSIVLYHIQTGQFRSVRLVNGLVIQMTNGLSATVSNNGTTISLVTSSVEMGLMPAINIIAPDSLASNGVLHEVDSAIVPYWFFFNPIQALGALPDTFGTFTSLIQAAGLTDVFAGLIASTILGPNNATFASLSTTTLNYLTDPANVDVLNQVLLYHVIDSLIPFTDLPIGEFQATTLLPGENITVTVTDNGSGGRLIRFNGVSGVGQGFFLTRDDLIYELGGVLIPPSLANVIPLQDGLVSQQEAINDGDPWEEIVDMSTQSGLIPGI